MSKEMEKSEFEILTRWMKNEGNEALNHFLIYNVCGLAVQVVSVGLGNLEPSNLTMQFGLGWTS